MEIIIDFHNKKLSEKLAFRLAALQNSLSIKTGFYSDEMFDICVTDKKEFSSDSRFVVLSDEVSFDDSIYSSSKHILNLIFERYKNNTGICFCENNSFNNVLSFFSFEGGSGVSSISITFARNLCLLGKKVLYITNTNLYFNYSYFESSNISKFEYEIYKNNTVNLEKYIFQDASGLNILMIRNYSILLNTINFIREYGQFDLIVIDCGTNKVFDISDMTFEIINNDDLRSSLRLNDKKNLVISNRTTINRTENFTIPFDLNSFRLGDNYIDISLNGTFSKSISSIIKSNNYGQ